MDQVVGRHVLRRILNAVDPAELYELSGDPEEYAVEIDELVRRFRDALPENCAAVIEQVRQVFVWTLGGGYDAGVLLPNQEILSSNGFDLGDYRSFVNPMRPATKKERWVGQCIWLELVWERNKP